MEDVDTISVAVSGIDINKVEALDTRRVVAFINHFLCTSVTFLNQFSSKCELKLDMMQQKLHRIESRLKILECKLASIPQSNLSVADTPSSTITSQASVPMETVPAAPTELENPKPKETSPIDSLSSISHKTETVTEVVTNRDDNSEKVDNEIPSETETVGGGDSKYNAKDDPMYAKYFKMIYVGVPVQAIKLKMMSEGLDPSILDS